MLSSATIQSTQMQSKMVDWSCEFQRDLESARFSLEAPPSKQPHLRREGHSRGKVPACLAARLPS
jgi:hypothetical protein